MRPKIAIGILIVFCFAEIRPILPFLDYYVNYEYISEVLCINKDKPMSTCNGKCYLSQQLKEAQKTETDVLWLGVWTQNFKALAFYRKYGFIEVGEHTFQLGADRQTDLILSTHLKSRAPDSPQPPP